MKADETLTGESEIVLKNFVVGTPSARAYRLEDVITIKASLAKDLKAEFEAYKETQSAAVVALLQEGDSKKCEELVNNAAAAIEALGYDEGKTLEDYGLNADGSGRFRWTEPDGTVREIPSSVKYVHQKDEHLHRAVAQVMGLRKIPFGT